MRFTQRFGLGIKKDQNIEEVVITSLLFSKLSADTLNCNLLFFREAHL